MTVLSKDKTVIHYAPLRVDFIHQRFEALQSKEDYLNLVDSLVKTSLYPLPNPIVVDGILQTFDTQDWIKLKAIFAGSYDSKNEFMNHFFDLFFKHANFDLNPNAAFFAKENALNLSEADKASCLKVFQENMQRYPLTQMILRFMETNHIVADESFYQACSPLFRKLSNHCISYTDFFPLFRWGLEKSHLLAKRIACISLIFSEFSGVQGRFFLKDLDEQLSAHREAQTVTQKLQAAGRQFFSMLTQTDKQEVVLPGSFSLDWMIEYGFSTFDDYIKFLDAFEVSDAQSETFLKFFNLAYQKAKKEQEKSLFNTLPVYQSGTRYLDLLKVCKSQVALLNQLYESLVKDGMYQDIETEEGRYKLLIVLAQFVYSAKNYENCSEAKFYIDFSNFFKNFTPAGSDVNRFIAVVNQVGFFFPSLNQYLIHFFHKNLSQIDNILPLADALLNLGSAGDGEDKSRTHYLCRFLEVGILEKLDAWSQLPEDQYIALQRNVCLFLEHMQKKTQGLLPSDAANQIVLNQLETVLNRVKSQFFTKINPEKTLLLSESSLSKQHIALHQAEPKSKQFFYERFKALTESASTSISNSINFYEAVFTSKVSFEAEVSQKYDEFVKNLSNNLTHLERNQSVAIETMTRFSKVVIGDQKILSEQVKQIESLALTYKSVNESNEWADSVALIGSTVISSVKEVDEKVSQESQSTQKNIQVQIAAIQQIAATLENLIKSEETAQVKAESYLKVKKSFDDVFSQYSDLVNKYHQQLNRYQKQLSDFVVQFKSSVKTTLRHQQDSLEKLSLAQQERHLLQKDLSLKKETSKIEQSSISSKVEVLESQKKDRSQSLEEINKRLQEKETELHGQFQQIREHTSKHSELIKSLNQVVTKSIEARKQAKENLKKTFWYFLAEFFSDSYFSSLRNWSSSHMNEINIKTKKLNKVIVQVEDFQALIARLVQSDQGISGEQAGNFLVSFQDKNSCFKYLKNDPFVWFFNRWKANSILDDVEKMKFEDMDLKIKTIKADQVLILNEQAQSEKELKALEEKLNLIKSESISKDKEIAATDQELVEVQAAIASEENNLNSLKKSIDQCQDLRRQLADIERSLPSLKVVQCNYLECINCLCDATFSIAYRLQQIDKFFQSITCNDDLPYVLNGLLRADTEILEAWVKKMVERDSSNSADLINQALLDGLSTLLKSDVSRQIPVLKKNILILMQHGADLDAKLENGDTVCLDFFKAACPSLLNEMGLTLLKNSKPITKKLNDLLYYAAEKCNASVIDLILKQDADLLLANLEQDGLTPLHHIIVSSCLSFKEKIRYIKEIYAKHQIHWKNHQQKISDSALEKVVQGVVFSGAVMPGIALAGLVLSNLTKPSESIIDFSYSQILDTNGNTLLHQAILDQDELFVDYLCECNPELMFIKNQENQYPWDLLSCNSKMRLWESLLNGLKASSPLNDVNNKHAYV